MYETFRRTLAHGGSFFAVQFLSRAIGLLSFPIITRLLTVEDYGILSIINAMLLFLYAFGKCGISNAVITFYHDSQKCGSKLLFNALLISVTFSSVISIFLLIILEIIQKKSNLNMSFYLIPIFVIFRNLFSINQAYLRAQSKITKHNVYDILIDAGGTICAILAICMVYSSLFTLLLSKAIFESISIFFIVFISYKALSKMNKKMDFSLMKDLFLFGFPLIWLEVSMIIMSFGDRLQISYMVNNEAVGQYAVAYNLGQYIKQLVAQPIMLAIYPIYSKLWAEKGKSETISFLNLILTFYVFIAVPIFIFMSIYSQDILILLASEKYANSAKIIPVIVGSTLINGTLPLISAGLYLNKKTKIIGKTTCLCAAVNVFLNFIFIHYYSYFGAAISTAITFILLNCLLKYKSDNLLRIAFPWAYFFKFLCLSILSLFLVMIISEKVENVFLATFVYFLLYFAMSWYKEKSLFNKLLKSN